MNSDQTVFVVDDNREVRNALSRVLGAAGYQVRSFESAERFFEGHDSEIPGCLLLDICMPDMSGLDVQRSLGVLRPSRPIIFLTGHADIQTSVHTMKAGAIDFLTKPIDHAQLIAAINQALQVDLAARNEWAIRQMIESRFEALTQREREVMNHVIRGRLNKQIAADLGIGEKTVKVHRGRIMSKAKVRSVAELVHLAVRVGVSPEAPGSKPAFSFSGPPRALTEDRSRQSSEYGLRSSFEPEIRQSGFN
jgi:FixJ family two-component response regulator